MVAVLPSLVLIIFISLFKPIPTQNQLTSLGPLKYNSIGKVCNDNSNCGENEYCNIPKLFQPPCRKGYCACKPCFANITASSKCETIHLERPCDLTCTNGTKPSEDCDDWCENDPPLKTLTANSYCIHFQRGKLSRRVICEDCYESRNRQCVPRVALDNKVACAEDCACATNLKCNGRCMCLTTNERWEQDMLTCIRRELDDFCIIDRDCDVEPDDEDFGGFYRGLACVRGRCKCAANFTSTPITYLDDHGNVVTKPVCIINGAVTKLTEREKCTFRNVYDGKHTTTRTCAPGLLCMACGDNPTKICRTVITNKGSKAQTCNATTFNPFLERSDKPKVGNACGRDAHCGPKEICFKHSVTPPCLEGVCQCQSCHAVGPDKYCMPIEILDLGSPCKNLTGVEVYPEDAGCQKGVVACNMYYKQSDKHCVPDAARYAMPGDECTTTANCFGVLKCSAEVKTTSSMNKQPRECGCQVGDNQHWEPDIWLCIGPTLGDPCQADSECTSHEYLPRSAKPRVCIHKECRCHPDHAEFKGHCFAKDLETKCPHCPEDPDDAPCRMSHVIEEDKTQEIETCLAQLSLSLYKLESETKPTVCKVQEAEPPKNKLGQYCLNDDECGPNEFCLKEDFAPACTYGKCTCKPCYDIGANNTCAPMIILPVNAMCFNTPNELWQQRRSDIDKKLTPIRCDDGIVRCSPCYKFVPKTGLCVLISEPTKMEGEPCENSCECLGDGVMMCGTDKRCTCRRISELFDEATKTCKPREIWNPCTTSQNCNNCSFTIDGGLCSSGYCACRQQYLATVTGFYDGTNIASKQICVHSQAKPFINRRVGAHCAQDPLRHASSLSHLHGGVCGAGLACITCDGQYDPTPMKGLCRKFSDTRIFPSDLLKTREQCTLPLINEPESVIVEMVPDVDNSETTIGDVQAAEDGPRQTYTESNFYGDKSSEKPSPFKINNGPKLDLTSRSSSASSQSFVTPCRFQVVLISSYPLLLLKSLLCLV